MTEQERYLFDLQGYLVVPNALTSDQLTRLNATLDARIEAEVAPDSMRHRFGRLLDWGPEYRALLDNETILPYLEEMLGDDFRLDHEYCDIIRSGAGPVGNTLHGGGTPFDPGQFYRWDNGRPRCGLTVVAYNLHDVNPGNGGFAAVAGSHKANAPFPNGWRDLNESHPFVTAVTGPAGAAIIFTEAMTHGTLPWNAPHDRRTLFYKFSPSEISWSASYYDPDAYADLTPRQRAILEPPNARYGGRTSRPH
jgi:ectoine hydroxylase-related dioxygenase (phytanoyl-CoA dioxygenase family)